METLTSSGLVATKSSQVKKQLHNFHVVVHSSHKKKSAKPLNNTSESVHNDNSSLLDMKKARFEVYKFSKSDLNFSSRQKNNVELAIQLGAKPPKSEAKNYKKLLEEKLIEAHKKKEESFVKQMSINYRSMMSDKKKKHSNKLLGSKPKPNQQGILGIYGKIRKKVPERGMKRKSLNKIDK